MSGGTESNTLFKIVVCLGAILLGWSLMGASSSSWVFIGQPLPPNSTWGQVQAQFTSFPVFNNPFGQQTQVQLGIGNGWPQIDSNGSRWYVPASTHGTNNSCSLGAYWNCLSDPSGPDYNLTYVTLASNPFGIVVNATGNLGSGVVQSGTITVYCTTNGAVDLPLYAAIVAPGNAFPSGVTEYLLNQGGGVYCPKGQTFKPVSISLTPFGNPVDLSTNPNQPNLQLFLGFGYPGSGPYPVMNISTIQVTLLISGYGTACGGSDFFTNIGCQLSQWANFALNLFMYGVNALIFAGQILLWFVGTVGVFFNAITAIFGFEGAPPLVAGFGGIFVIGCILYIAFVFFSRVRGTGTTG